MKRVLSIVLVMAMLFSVLVLPATAVTLPDTSTYKPVISPLTTKPAEWKVAEYPSTATKTKIEWVNTGYDVWLMTVRGADEDGYKAYWKALTDLGGYTRPGAENNETKYAEPAVLGSDSSQWKAYYSDEYLVNIYYDDHAKVLRVSQEPNDYTVDQLNVLTKRNKAETLGSYASQLIQIGMGGTGGIENGMAFAYRLSNGHFVVYDGGGKDDATGTNVAARIYKALSEYNKIGNGGKGGDIVIDAWIITHPHTDHILGFTNFVKYYISQNQATLKNVIWYPLNPETQTSLPKAADGAKYAVSQSKLDSYNKIMTALEANDTAVWKAHAGQKYYFDNLMLEILFTYDMLTGDTYVPNQAKRDASDDVEAIAEDNLSNTFSIISRATINYGSGSHTAIFAGDATPYSLGTVNEHYGTALKSDFLQVPHHGFLGDFTHIADHKNGNLGILKTFYENVKPKYVLIPAGKSHHTNQNYDAGSGTSNTTDPGKNLNGIAKSQDGGVYYSDDLQVRTFGLNTATVTVAAPNTSIFNSLSTPTLQKDGGYILVKNVIGLTGISGTDKYKLANDITVVGDFASSLVDGTFKGELDGNGHTIDLSNATFTFTNISSGTIFSTLTDATVKNLNVVGATVTQSGSDGFNSGILAAKADVSGNTATLIENVYVNGTFTNNASKQGNAGGLVGQTNTAEDGATGTVTFKNCTFDGSITQSDTYYSGASAAKTFAGGIVGRLGSKTESFVVDGCVVGGSVKQYYAGGIAGRVCTTGSQTIRNCVINATISATSVSRLLVSNIFNGQSITVENCVSFVKNADGWVRNASSNTDNTTHNLNNNHKVDTTSRFTMGASTTSPFTVNVNGTFLQTLAGKGFAVKVGALATYQKTLDQAHGVFTKAAIEGLDANKKLCVYDTVSIDKLGENATSYPISLGGTNSAYGTPVAIGYLTLTIGGNTVTVYAAQ